jgi:hypothetical protein
MKSIIFFETNEIPWRVADEYATKNPNSALARVISQSQKFETICDDESLDPWTSWSTLYRGVSDKKHGIMHLGQAIDYANANFPPIWSLLHAAGKSVGVFGSLNSSPVPADARDYAFFVPDVFAVEAFAHPAFLIAFQEFNLKMTRRSARNVDTSIPIKEALRFGTSVVRNGLTARTVAIVL